MVEKQKVEDFWARGGDIELFGGKLKVKYDKESNFFGIYGRKWFSRREIDKIVNEVSDILRFYEGGNIRMQVRKMDIVGWHMLNSKFTLRLLIFFYKENYVDVKSVYMIDGKLEINLSDFNKIKENEKEFDDYDKKESMKVRKKLLSGKYSMDDILKCGGLKLVYNHSLLYAGIQKNDSDYVLSIPYGSWLKIVVKTKGYDLSGSIIWKVILVDINSNNVHQIFLLGKEYTGNWWMHSLPPSYWNKSIASCERWLLGLKKGDVVVSEA